MASDHSQPATPRGPTPPCDILPELVELLDSPPINSGPRTPPNDIPPQPTKLPNSPLTNPGAPTLDITPEFAELLWSLSDLLDPLGTRYSTSQVRILSLSRRTTALLRRLETHVTRVPGTRRNSIPNATPELFELAWTGYTMAYGDLGLDDESVGRWLWYRARITGWAAQRRGHYRRRSAFT